MTADLAAADTEARGTVAASQWSVPCRIAAAPTSLSDIGIRFKSSTRPYADNSQLIYISKHSADHCTEMKRSSIRGVTRECNHYRHRNMPSSVGNVGDGQALSWTFVSRQLTASARSIAAPRPASSSLAVVQASRQLLAKISQHWCSYGDLHLRLPTYRPPSPHTCLLSW